jgi:hypothetical protein
MPRMLNKPFQHFKSEYVMVVFLKTVFKFIYLAWTFFTAASCNVWLISNKKVKGIPTKNIPAKLISADSKVKQ